MALEIVRSLRKRIRWACFRAAWDSGLTSLRFKPSLFRARVVAGLPSASIYGGMSWTTLLQPPMMDMVPMRQN